MASPTSKQLAAARSDLVRKGKAHYKAGRNFPRVKFSEIRQKMADEIAGGLDDGQAICLWYCGKFGGDKPEIDYLILGELRRRHPSLQNWAQSLRREFIRVHAENYFTK